MYQFRCNHCFAKYDGLKITFFLLQCGHLFCGKCMSQQAGKRCLECDTESDLSVCLKDPLPQNIAPYFVPMPEALQKLVQTATFQENQLRVTWRKFAQLKSKYNAVKSMYWRLEHDMKNLMQGYLVLKKSVRTKESELHDPQVEYKKTNIAYHEQETPMCYTDSISLHSAVSLRFSQNTMRTPYKIETITSHQDSANVDTRVTPTGNIFLVSTSRATKPSDYPSKRSGGILKCTPLASSCSNSSRYYGSIVKRNLVYTRNLFLFCWRNTR